MDFANIQNWVDHFLLKICICLKTPDMDLQKKNITPNLEKAISKSDGISSTCTSKT